MRKTLALVAGLAAGAAAFAALATASPTAPRTVTIVHVQRGCHSWSVGNRMAATVTISLRRGTALRIVNNDVDVHRLVQVAGPRIGVGGPMMMSHSRTLSFGEAGVYRLRTRVVEMKGMGMHEVETIGPDHRLALTVRVR